METSAVETEQSTKKPRFMKSDNSELIVLVEPLSSVPKEAFAGTIIHAKERMMIGRYSTSFQTDGFHEWKGSVTLAEE